MARKSSEHDAFILRYAPVQRFVNGLGERVRAYIGKDKGCVLALGDDGIFYAEGLCVWLRQRKVDVVFTKMDYDGSGLEPEKVRGRKVVAVDNDIVTGTAYKNVMEWLRANEKRLKFEDVKYAVMCDRTHLADFAVEDYATTAGAEMIRLDGTDYKILQRLKADGRASFAEIAEETNLTVSGVKKRFERLVKGRIFQVRGHVMLGQFYSISALVAVEMDSTCLQEAMRDLAVLPMVYALVRVYDRHNLVIGVAAASLDEINGFVDNHIGRRQGVRDVVVHIGELPVLPVAV